MTIPTVQRLAITVGLLCCAPIVAGAQDRYEWPGGTEDPRLVESPDGRYIMTYTQWNGDVPRLAVATSPDLLTWTNHGPAFARARDGRFLRTESKSGAILVRVDAAVIAVASVWLLAPLSRWT